MTEQQVRIFTSSDGQAQLEVALDQETVWLSQAQMGQLFDTTLKTCSCTFRTYSRIGNWLSKQLLRIS